MKIVADDAIVGLQLAFGSVTAIPGRSIDAAAVRDADVLLTRSITRVDAALVDGSSLQFVGSATAGIDHIDTNALATRGIAFAHAPGCNAPAVVDYVQEAMGERPGPVGIVGVGAVGGRLADALERRGVEVLLNDPPKDPDCCPLPDLLQRANVVTFHVPDVREGPHPTFHLLDFAQLRPGVLVINTSRGSVVDNAALERWLAMGGGEAVLDVWEGEPQLRWDLLERDDVVLATPHIAGYDRLGKATATAMLHVALADHLGRAATVTPADVLALLPAAPGEPLRATDRRLRALLQLPLEQRAAAFEQLRRTYTLR